MPVIPALTVAVPLVVAGFLAAVGAHLPRPVVKSVALGTAVATAALQFAELVQSWHHPLDHWFGGWTPRHGVAIGIVFTVSPLDAGLACVVGVLAVSALVYAWRGLPDPGHLFYVLMLAFVAGMSGFAVSGDLFNMFVFFELMSIAGYALCGYRNTSSPVVQGAVNFAVLNSIGAVCILMGIALVYGRTGALNLAQIGATLDGHRPDGLVVVSFVLIVVGFLVKAGAVPFHFWLSDAYAVAAAPVGALYAGIMSDLGYHAIVRVYSHAYAGTLGGAHLPAVRDVFVGVGVVTAVVGAVMCYLQADIKRQLAFLVVSHGGIFFAALGLLSAAGVAGSTLYVAADGMLKGALFLVAGFIVATLGASDELWLRGRGRSRRQIGAGLTVAACGLGFAALPGTGTWQSAALVVRAAGDAGFAWLPPVLGAATALTAGTVLRTGARVFLGFGPPSDPALTSRQPDEPNAGEVANVSVPGWALTPAWLLAAVGLALSAAPTLTGRALASATGSLDFHGYLDEVLHARPPSAPDVLPRIAAHGGEWLYGAATTIGALLVAVTGLFWPLLPAAVRRGGSALLPAVRRLKAAHSGSLGDYVVWFGAGVVALFAVAGAALR